MAKSKKTVSASRLNKEDVRVQDDPALQVQKEEEAEYERLMGRYQNLEKPTQKRLNQLAVDRGYDSLPGMWETFKNNKILRFLYNNSLYYVVKGLQKFMDSLRGAGKKGPAINEEVPKMDGSLESEVKVANAIFDLLDPKQDPEKQLAQLSAYADEVLKLNKE